jgi:hypothetical protein
MTAHDRDLPVESEKPSRLVAAASAGSDTTRRLTLITSPEPVSVCIPSPIFIVRRLADKSEMARFPATAHQLAKKMARRWRAPWKALLLSPGRFSAADPRARRGHRERSDAPPTRPRCRRGHHHPRGCPRERQRGRHRRPTRPRRVRRAWPTGTPGLSLALKRGHTPMTFSAYNDAAAAVWLGFMTRSPNTGHPRPTE